MGMGVRVKKGKGYECREPAALSRPFVVSLGSGEYV